MRTIERSSRAVKSRESAFNSLDAGDDPRIFKCGDANGGGDQDLPQTVSETRAGHVARAA